MDLQQLAMQVAKVAQDAGRHAAQDQLTPHLLKTNSRADDEANREKYSSDIDDTVVRYLREKVVQLNPLDGFWEEVGSERTPGSY